MTRSNNAHTELVKGILEYLEWISKSIPIYFIKSSSGAVKTASGRWFSTGKPGCPDVTLLYHGIYIGLEAKTGTGSQSLVQIEAQAEIEAAGGRYYVVRSIEDVKEVFK